MLTATGIYFYSKGELNNFHIPHRNGVRFGGKAEQSDTIYVIFEKNNIYWVTEYVLDIFSNSFKEFRVVNNYHSDQVIKDLVIINKRLALIVGEERQLLVKINVINELIED